MHPCGHRHEHAHTHIHTMHTSVPSPCGKVETRGDGWKRGPYVGQWRAPLARGSTGGDVYTHTHVTLSLSPSPSPIHFLPPRRIFYRSVFLLTRVWRDTLPLIRQPQIPFSFTLRRPSSSVMWSAKVFISNIFDFDEGRNSRRLTRLWMEWCDQSRWSCKAVYLEISYSIYIYWMIRKVFYDTDAEYILSAMNLSLTNLKPFRLYATLWRKKK